MFERFKSRTSHEDEVEDEHKRKFIKGAMAAVVLTMAGQEALSEEVKGSNSGYFQWYKENEKQSLERDEQLAVEHDDLVKVLQEKFKLTNIDNQELRENLEALVIGKVFVESRFDVNAKSDRGAFGMLQIMPDTAKDLIKQGEDIHSLDTQIKIAARYLEQSYAHIMQTCRQSLEIIKQNHFGGDEYSFTTYFLTPLMINSYNGGMGTMATLTNQFASRFPTADSLIGLFDNDNNLTNFDVFIAMSHTAYNEEWIEWYSEDSISYTPRIYAGYEVVRNAILNKASNQRDARAI